jgi:predicted MFS family arabinose efflux permease
MHTASDTRAENPLPLSTWQLTAMTIVVCTGFSSQMLVPIWIGQVIEKFAVSSGQAGTIASIEFMSVAITSLTMATLIGRLPSRRVCLIGTLGLLLGNLICVFAPSVEMLTAARVVCGIGKGFVVAVIFGLAGQTASPVRAFAVLNAAYAGFSAVLFLVVPIFVKDHGIAGAFGAMVALSLLGIAFVHWVPQSHRDPPGRSWRQSLPLVPLGLMMLAGLALMWTAHGSIWVFIERIGVRDGLALTAIGATLSVGAMLSILGPLSSRVLEIRRGAALPIVAGIVILATTAGLLCFVEVHAVYYVATPVFSMAGLFVLPYVMGLLGYVDPSGKLSASSSAFMTLGGSLGPFIGGWVIDLAGYPTLAFTAWALFGLVLVAMLPLALRHDADRPRAPLAQLDVETT